MLQQDAMQYATLTEKKTGSRSKNGDRGSSRLSSLVFPSTLGSRLRTRYPSNNASVLDGSRRAIDSLYLAAS